MKWMSLFAFLISLAGFSALAQTDVQLKVDTIINGNSISKQPLKDFFKGDSTTADNLKNRLNEALANHNRFQGKIVVNNQKLGSNVPFDNMPCLKPDGYYPMKVYSTADSTVRYNMPIKKYKLNK